MLRGWTSVLAAMMLMTGSWGGAHAQEPQREITQISGDLYRFQNNFHYSVFLVTPEGVIVTDPINAEAATWLKAEIAQRFDKPIKYMVYSHHHDDHISGGEVFADEGVTVIAHENAVAQIKEKNVPTAPPTETFADSKTIELGGKKVELLYVGRNHTDDMLVAHFPDERTLFTVDFISTKRLPWRALPGSFYPDWVESIDKVAAMDFDILAPGHGDLGTKQDAVDHGQYLRDLHDAVKAGVDNGQSLDDLKSAITMENYKEWGQYGEWLKENIEGMYNHVTN